MALRAVPDHPKFAELQVSLEFSRFQALGALEAIWHFCGRFTPQGNIGKYSDHAIELWVGWSGHPGEFIAAMVAAGWLDRDPDHRLLVHDWHDHADGATKLALKRKGLSFIRTTSAHCRDSVRTESRLPEPVAGAVPVPEPEPEPEPVAGAVPVVECRSNSPVVAFAPIITATAPASAAPPSPVVLPTKTERQAAAELVQSLSDARDAAGLPVGSPDRAIAAASLRLTGVADLQHCCDEMRENHAAFLPGWVALRAREPAGFVPFLSVWFSEGDCLRRPCAPANASNTTTGRPPIQTEFRTTADYLRYKKARLTNAG